MSILEWCLSLVIVVILFSSRWNRKEETNAQKILDKLRSTIIDSIDKLKYEPPTQYTAFFQFNAGHIYIEDMHKFIQVLMKELKDRTERYNNLSETKDEQDKWVQTYRTALMMKCKDCMPIGTEFSFLDNKAVVSEYKLETNGRFVVVINYFIRTETGDKLERAVFPAEFVLKGEV